MTAVVDKIKEAVLPKSRDASCDNNSVAETERGRRAAGEPIAVGRGGAGNILRSMSPPTSRGRHGGATLTAEEERVQSRERARSRENVHAVGRGGAGNMRSPSRKGLMDQRRDVTARAQDEAATKKLDNEERVAQAEFEHHHNEHVESHGRGGVGNIQ